MILPTWLTISLSVYIAINVVWLLLMVIDIFNGVGHCETPSDFRDCNGINMGGAIFIFILYILFFPLYNLLLWTIKLIDWLFHIGVKDRGE